MRVLVFVLSLCVSAPAATQVWIPMLKNTPAERFDEDDLRIFMDLARKALDQGKENETLSWENPKTRHGGDVTVLRSFEWKGYGCKEVRINNRAEGRQAENHLNWCKVEGKWRLVSDAQIGKN